MTSFTTYAYKSFNRSPTYAANHIHTPAADTAGWRVYCHCNGEVSPEKDGETCPQHQFKDHTHGNSPGRQQLRFEIPTYHNTSRFREATATRHGHSHRGNSHHYHAPPVSDLPDQGYSFTCPPSMNGWWRCCQCAQDVNSAWYQTDCTNCSHRYCDYCYNLGYTPIPQ